MNTKNSRVFIAALAIVSVVILEIYALHEGIDGAALSASIGVVGLIVGYFWKTN